MRAIITFHGIDDAGAVTSFSSAAFAHLMDGLAATSLPVLSLEELLSGSAARGVVITFDDGYRSVATTALPVLRDRGLTAHLFLATSLVGKTSTPIDPGHRRPMLSWDEVETLHSRGIRIETHTAGHTDLRRLSRDGIISECAAADDAIASRLGRPPRYLAYPFGFHDARVREVVRSRYAAAMTTELRPLSGREDPMALPRLDSFYLKSKWLQKSLCGTPARAYLALRHAGRRLRGHPG